MKMSRKVEYRVRPVTRYIVTRFECEQSGDGIFGSAVASTQRGVFENEETAYEVAYALCRREHEISGLPHDSKSFVYPESRDGNGEEETLRFFAAHEDAIPIADKIKEKLDTVVFDKWLTRYEKLTKAYDLAKAAG